MADRELVDGVMREMYEAMADLGAPPELLATVGSWSDTLDDETVLRHLKAYNKNGTIYAHVICRLND